MNSYKVINFISNNPKRVYYIILTKLSFNYYKKECFTFYYQRKCYIFDENIHSNYNILMNSMKFPKISY